MAALSSKMARMAFFVAVILTVMISCSAALFATAVDNSSVGASFPSFSINYSQAVLYNETEGNENNHSGIVCNRNSTQAVFIAGEQLIPVAGQYLHHSTEGYCAIMKPFNMTPEDLNITDSEDGKNLSEPNNTTTPESDLEEMREFFRKFRTIRWCIYSLVLGILYGLGIQF